MRPIVINLDGSFQLAHGAIRVGEATQPYHAVPLSQVKKMLSMITVTGSVFRVRSEFTFGDRVVGFCLSEPDAQEPLDYIYTGKIVEETHLITDNVVMPPVLQPIQEIINVIDIFNPYTLSDPGEDVGEIWDTVSTGKFVDVTEWEDTTRITEITKAIDTFIIAEDSSSHTLSEKGYTDGNIGYVYTGVDNDAFSVGDTTITAIRVVTTENIPVIDVSASHVLGEKGWSDGNIGYVYTGTDTDNIVVEDTFITAVKTITTETITTNEIDKSDLVFISLPEKLDTYPDEGIVVQKTKPSPLKETKKVGDTPIIKRKYKVSDSCAFKDKAFACCLSDAFVAEPLTTMLYATVRETVTSESTPENSTLEVT
jgi:hypothetical protein